jgi:hypothetical protein
MTYLRPGKKIAGLCVLALCLLLPATRLRAESSKYAAAFLDIPVGVRALGLGGQYSPIDNVDGTAFYWNPAGVSLAKDKVVTSLYSNQFGSLGDPLSNYMYIGYTQELGNGVGVSINWIRNSISNIPLTDAIDINGDIAEQLRSGGLLNNGATFSNSDDAVFVSIAKNIATSVDFGWQYFDLPIEFPIGITFKYINQGFSGNSRVNYSGTGVGIDVGSMLKFNLGKFVANPTYGDLALGVIARDLFNTPVSWDTELKTKGTIKRSFLFSFSYKQPLPFISSSLLFAFTRDTKYDGLSSWGFEYKFRELVALRLGSYDTNITLGAGLFLLQAVYVDYAYQFSDLGGAHRVGLTLNLSRLL